MGGNVSGCIANVSGFFGSLLIVGSLPAAWTSSDIVSSGLFKKCILYPGQEMCSGVAESSDLSFIKSSAILTSLCAFVATGMSCSAGLNARRKLLSSGLYLVSAITGVSSGSMYTNSFSLCSEANYGDGYKLMLAGATFNLFASILNIVSSCGDSSAETDQFKSEDTITHSSRGKRLRRSLKKVPARLKRLPAQIKDFKSRNRKGNYDAMFIPNLM